MSAEAGPGKLNIDPAAASKIRHDLRTPINQIIGYSQILQEDARDGGHEGYLPDLGKIETAARRLVELIDHHLDASRIAAPAAPAAAIPKAAPDAEPAVPAVRNEVPEDGGGHLLVVDDDAMNRDMLARRLERKGYKVDVACDGHEALDRVLTTSRDRYHLILLDVMMPGISGLDVLRKVRESYTVADLPIIMATAMDASEDVVQALHNGANDYVTKPLDFSVVLARVGTQLALKRAKDQIQQMAAELEVKNRFIRKTFGRFLSDEVVSSLLESPEGLRLGGEKRKVTILMSDLRGFTALAERVTPEQLVSILNNHLGKMADIVMSFGGTIDEFIGDAVLAIFGAPVSRPDDAARAVACAIAMQRAVQGVNDENVREGLPEIAMGIALNTGDVVVGNIGSHKRMKYGVVGTHVNLTSRIESYTVGGQVLISESTLRDAGPGLIVGGQMAVRAKGFSDLITAHELKGIGEPYNLRMPEAKDELTSLETGVGVQYALLDGKAVTDEASAGRIVKLSLRGAQVAATEAPELLTNLHMRLTDQTGVPLHGDIYAKVIDRAPEKGGWFAIVFTSLPPHVERYFRGLVGAA